MVKLVLGLYHRCLKNLHGYFGIVKLVIGLHHVNQGGDHREFWNGEANIWASPYESLEMIKRSLEVVKQVLKLYY